MTWLSLILTKLLSHTEKYIFYLHFTILSCYLKFMASEVIKKKWNCRFVKIKRFSEYSVQYTANDFITQTSFVKIHKTRNVEEIKLKKYKKNFCENRKQTNEWTTKKAEKRSDYLFRDQVVIYICIYILGWTRDHDKNDISELSWASVSTPCRVLVCVRACRKYFKNALEHVISIDTTSSRARDI